jgi:outer membrane protein assembly factor BamB
MHLRPAVGRLLLLCLLFGLLLPAWRSHGHPPSNGGADDWPMSRHDARRSGASAHDLPARLRLLWTRDYPPLEPAWPDQPKLQFDAVYDPVVLDRTLFLGSPKTDTVTALDTATGAEKWCFHADGPIRFAPAGWEGRLYVASDDGHLYCLDAGCGTLLWKFRGGPSDRKVLGNERLISTWPARGGPVVADGTVYFAAGIWPFMGIFLHALDAPTGKVIWSNSGDGSLYIKQPHYADAFAGVAPQGALVVAGDKLLIPGGRSVPACYDRKTGKLVHYLLAENGKRGGSDVAAGGGVYVNGGAAYETATGAFLGPVGDQVVLTPDAAYSAAGADIQTLEGPAFRAGSAARKPAWPPFKGAAVKWPGALTFIKAGSRLYVGSPGQVAALELPLAPTAAPAWKADIEGRPGRLLAGDDKLFVVTREGRICCFGAEDAEQSGGPPAAPSPAPEPPHDAWTERAADILKQTGVTEGYCVSWGAGSGRLVTELARQSRLRIIAVEPDPQRVESVRKDLLAAGLYGQRVSVIPGDPHTAALPPYLASLMVSEDLAEAGVEITPEVLANLLAVLRPYGGQACLPVPGESRRAFHDAVAALHSEQARLLEGPAGTLLVREGALPGSANWTHEHADSSNTRVSHDTLVKAPLGLLWFGGPSDEGILPRHGHGPQPQVIDGREIIEGADMLRALDIYTGRLLWEARLPGVGKVYDNTSHQPGANATGTNYVSLSDGIYVIYDRVCVCLDPATGHRLAEFRLPPAPTGEPQFWSYVTVHDDYLIGGADPATEQDLVSRTGPTSSKRLVVMDRHTGKVLWTATARAGFRHNAICAGPIPGGRPGDGRLYAIDRVSSDVLARLKRRGEKAATKARLAAFDLRTGQTVWQTEDDVFGTWLSYSARHDVLVEAGRVARDTLADEPKGMRAYRAGTGSVLWYQRSYLGPAMLHGDMILKDQSACDLLTGAAVMRPDPLSGLPVEWTWSRGYGCNTPAASEHLLTFRSGAAGYFDLEHDGGTGNFGGFRSSCTNNLIVAGGLLNSPDYTRSCTCSYQNQSSLALIHMPEAEMWTYFGKGGGNGPVRRAGINLGAPGDRRADDGLLWLEYPSVGGVSPSLPVRTTPARPEWFRRHSGEMLATVVPWVGASGAKGLTALTVTLGGDADRERTYTVRLHFAEPDQATAGQRVFHVGLQGKEVLKDFDIVKEAGGPLRGVVKEFRGVRVKKDLTVTLSPSAGVPVLCGVEVTAEGW